MKISFVFVSSLKLSDSLAGTSLGRILEVLNRNKWQKASLVCCQTFPMGFREYVSVSRQYEGSEDVFDWQLAETLNEHFLFDHPSSMNLMLLRDLVM